MSSFKALYNLTSLKVILVTILMNSQLYSHEKNPLSRDIYSKCVSVSDSTNDTVMMTALMLVCLTLYVCKHNIA